MGCTPAFLSTGGVTCALCATSQCAQFGKSPMFVAFVSTDLRVFLVPSGPPLQTTPLYRIHPL